MANDLMQKLPTTAELTHEGAGLFEKVQSLAVIDKETHGWMQAAMVKLKAGRQFVIDKIAPIKDPAYETWQAACNLQREQTGPYDACLKLADKKCGDYEREEEARAQRAAIEEANRRRKEEEDRKIAEAELTVANGGSQEEAAEILEEPIRPTPVAPAPAFAKVSGVAKRGRWQGSIADRRKFIRWLAKQPDNDPWFEKFELGQEDMNAAARTHELALPDRVPGLKAEWVTSRSVSSK